MGKYNFTENQLKAIKTSGSDLLVSAAAGSGKTAVLTERIIEKLIDPSSDFDVTDFLIVTFTVSATSELRAKLSSAINEAYIQNKNLKKLKRQLLKLPLAKIMTIDAFCKHIVNECARELGVPADISLGDEGELKMIISEAVISVTDELFEGADYSPLFDISYLPK
ncbi:MAG: UvrD-helicase domain-containing protein, partial [Clostridia bacterium]|nr:UvrD-helicase domain-containing protein [Clostridia bacterium]